MKTLLVLVLCLPFEAAAQLWFDTAYVTFRGDTTEIWQKGYRNCTSKYITEVIQSGDTLNLVQTDTSSLHATCDCYFTMRATVVGLPAG